MNLLYDISVLGLAHVDSRSRTGVYRVVENVAIGVMKTANVELELCASIGNNRECLDFLRGHQLLSRYDQSFIPDLSASLDKMTGGSGFWKLLASKFTRPVVYHSPYHPIPLDIRIRPDVRKVLTVYDLIAVLFPDYFGEGGDLHCRDILESLTPDTNVICISESTRRDLCNLSTKVNPERVFVTHLAASAMFHPCLEPEAVAHVRQKYGIPEGGCYFLSVCTLEPRKNIEQVIRSFARLVLEQNLSDLCLVLTGTKGWKYDKIFSEIEHAAVLEGRIILTGYVPDEDLAPLYGGALAFVYPSIYEGFGLPPLEAMQCGTPVITSNTSSLPEVVGDAGIMVDPKDSDALCQAMLELYRDAGLRSSLVQKSLERAARFSWERCVQETIAVYRKAVQ
jgi:glycosyltransferase involved in cell wall biosynthesis